MIFMGIDPGTVRVGYGVIRKIGSSCKYISSGLIPIKSKERGGRLIEIEKAITSIIKTNKPAVVGVERIFFAKNVKTAIDVAHARGVIIAAIAKCRDTKLCELNPSEIKMAVAGDGGASKAAVAKMVGLTLKISQSGVIDDVSDAIATAIATSYIWG